MTPLFLRRARHHLLWVTFMAGVLCAGYHNNASSHAVGVVAGRQVYLKAFGHTVWFSFNGNPCAKASEETDYISSMMNLSVVYYRLEGSSIVVGHLWDNPTRGSSGGIQIRVRDIPAHEFMRLEGGAWRSEGWSRWKVAFDTTCPDLW